MLSSNLKAWELEEILLLRHLQKMLLDIAVNLVQQTCISHAAGKIAIGDSTLGIHLGEKVVTTDLQES